jgi:putative nucleotidyltransferase with HDIG domain
VTRGAWLPLLLLEACAHAPLRDEPLRAALLRRVAAGGPNHQHALRLAALAPALARAEGADPALVVAAALLHDATKEDGAGTPRERFCTHGQQGAANARAVLPGAGFDAARTEVVASAIEQHMGPQGESPARHQPRFMTSFCDRAFPTPVGPEARVLYDLDMLDLMTVHGVAKVVALRQRGTEFGRETVEASALTGPDSAWKSVEDAGETLLTRTGRACGAEVRARTWRFLSTLDFGAVTTVPAFQAAVLASLAENPLPACVDPAGPTAGR